MDKKLLKELNRARRRASWLPAVIVPTMSTEDYAYLGEQMHKYEGFYIQKRSLRDYQIDFGANFLGYIQEIYCQYSLFLILNLYQIYLFHWKF